MGAKGKTAVVQLAQNERVGWWTKLVSGLCQLSRHDEASDVDRPALGYAVTIIPLSWANRS